MTLSTERMGHGQRLVALQLVLEQIRLQQEVEPLLGLALDFIQRIFDYPLVWIATYNASQRELKGVQGAMPNMTKTAWARQELQVLPGDHFDQVLLTGQPSVVGNLQEDSRAGQWQAVARRTNIQGTLIYPLQDHEQPYGLMILGSHHWGGNPRPEDMTHLSILSGALGAALKKLQPQFGQSQEQFYQSLQTAINQLSQVTGLEEQLTVVLQQLHQALMPTQTSLYWLDTQQDCFWQRLVNQTDQPRRARGKKVAPLEVPLSGIQPFYQSLQAGQVVAVSEIQGVINSHAPSRLMHQIKRRSLLSAPIMYNQQLCGFLAVEGKDPRVWQDQEKELIYAFAQIASLASPQAAETEAIQGGLDNNYERLISHILESVAKHKDWPSTQQQIMELVCRHFQTEWMAILSHDQGTGCFQIVHQIHTPKLKPSKEPLQPLSNVDWNMMRRSDQAIAIDDLTDDLRLLAWRPMIDGLGIKTLLLSQPPQDQQPDQILLLGGLTPRTWTVADRQLINRVCQALQAGMQRHQLQVEHQQQQSLQSLVQHGLAVQVQASEPKQLIADALHSLLEVLPAPAAAVVLWENDQAEIASCTASPPDFDLNQHMSVGLDNDPLLQRLLLLGPPQSVEGAFENMVQLPVQEIAPDTRTWLNCQGLGQILAMPLLDTEQYQSMGAVIFCDRTHRTWEPLLVESVAMLVRHLAGRYRSILSLKRYREQQEFSDCLRWYQYRQVERHCQTALSYQQKLQDEHSASLPLLSKSRGAIEDIEKLIKIERSEFRLDDPPRPITSLLRHALARIETLANQRQLWTQVHNLTSSSTAMKANPKLEMVLYELLLAACYRSQAGQRIDIWCRLANPQWLELSMTDQGIINPQLITDLNNTTRNDGQLSTLDSAPGKHLRACQTLVTKLNGSLEFTQLEDGRILSRLMLPLT